MDAGTATLNTHKGRLRQQLLNGEQNIDALNQPLPQQQQSYSNYDIMTPVNAPAAGGSGSFSSRKGASSITSQSTMNRFFRRNRNDGAGAFDEDLGADIGELTNGSNMSFDDLSHIRDRGPYAIKTSSNLDSTPFIPTLGSNNIKHVNNISYRKQMNQQKKLAMVNGARAMSLASGSNPVNPGVPSGGQAGGPYYHPQQYPNQYPAPPHHQQQQPFVDPRSMSLSGNQNSYRAMSLNSNPPGAPRTMSLNTNRMFPPQPPHIHPQQQPQQPGGPRAMSMRPFPPPNQQFHPGYIPQQGPPPNGPRTMSLNSNPSYGPHPQQQFQPVPPPNNAYYANQNGHVNGPRTKSLGGMGTPPQPYLQQQQQLQKQPPQVIPPPSQQHYAYGIPQHHPQPGQDSYQQQPLQTGIQPPPNSVGNNVHGQHNSNESLMHVVEEDEESTIDHPIEESTRVISSSGRKPPPPDSKVNDYNVSLPLSSSSPIRSDKEEDSDEDDAIYKFEPEDEAQSLSRKSTLKKSNSMRLRKINLFNKNTTNSESTESTTKKGDPIATPPDEESELPPHQQNREFDQLQQQHISPSFNLHKSSHINNEDEGVRESIYDEQEDITHSQNHREQLGKLGATATNNTTKDVFVTASDLSPEKRQISPAKEKKLPQLPGSEEPEDTDVEQEEEGEDDTIINKENLSHELTDSSLNDLKNDIEDEGGDHEHQHDRTNGILKERGSPSSSKANLSTNSQASTPSLTQKTWLKAVPHKSLIANTAFSNFRSPSSETHAKFNNSNAAVLPLENENEFSGGSQYNQQQPPQQEEEDHRDEDDDDEDDLNDLPSPQVDSPDKSIFPNPPSMASSMYASIAPDSPVEAVKQGENDDHEDEEEEEEEEDSHESSNKSVNDNIGTSTPPTASTSNVSNNNYWNIPNYNNMNYNANPTNTKEISPIPQASIPTQGQQPMVYNSPTQGWANSKIRSTNTAELMSSPIKDSIPLPGQKSLNNNVNYTSNTPLTNQARRDSSANSSNVNSSNDKERRSSRTFSLSGSSKNLFKRLSLSGKRSNSNNTNVEEGNNRRHSSLTSSSPNATPKQPPSRRVSSTSIYNSPTPQHSVQPSPQKPTASKVTFTKEELGIMNCNNELLYELELVTTELASSIKRELGLENRLKNNGTSPMQEDYLHSELMSKSKTISELQEKLNKERRLRFVSEEHALLMEHGQNPSPLKLNYEKTELYKQLLIKNDLVHQLEDKLNEEYSKNQQYQYQIQQEQKQNEHVVGNSGQRNTDSNLLEKYNELLKENTDLKFRVIPELEKTVEYNQNEVLKLSNNNQGNRQLSLLNEEYNNGSKNGGKSFSNGNGHDESIEQISMLKNQREELRDTVTKMTMNHNYELKLYQDRIKALEMKVKDTKYINDKLSGRAIDQQQQQQPHNDGSFHNVPKSYSSNFEALKTGGGGKLSGFTIVTPTKKFID